MKIRSENSPMNELPSLAVERLLFKHTDDDLIYLNSAKLQDVLESNTSLANFVKVNLSLSEEVIQERTGSKYAEIIDIIKESNRKTKRMPKRFPTKLIEIKETVNTPINDHHFFGKISTEHSIDNTKSAHSQSDRLSQSQDKRLKKNNIIKLAREDILTSINRKQQRPNPFNLQSTEVEFKFLFRYQAIIEKIIIRVPSNVSLLIIRNIFISKINEKKIALEGPSIRKPLNPDKFIFKMLNEEIDEYQKEDFENLDSEDFLDVSMSIKVSNDQQFSFSN